MVYVAQDCTFSFEGAGEVRDTPAGEVSGSISGSGTGVCNPGGALNDTGTIEVASHFSSNELQFAGLLGEVGQVGFGLSSCFSQGTVTIDVADDGRTLAGHTDVEFVAPSGDRYSCRLYATRILVGAQLPTDTGVTTVGG